MKLILASEGFYTDEIVSATEKLVGKSRDVINIAVINEGYAVQPNNLRWVLQNLNDVQKHFGGKLELVNLLALDLAVVKEKIEACDVIFVVGGHVDYLMSVFNKSGFAKLLPELLATKVYVGSSAGSMVMGKRLPSEMYAKLYEQKDEYVVDRYMEFVDFSFVAHLESADFPQRKAILMEAIKGRTDLSIYGLRDDSAVIIEDKEVTTIGSTPLLIKQ